MLIHFVSNLILFYIEFRQSAPPDWNLTGFKLRFPFRSGLLCWENNKKGQVFFARSSPIAPPPS